MTRRNSAARYEGPVAEAAGVSRMRGCAAANNQAATHHGRVFNPPAWSRSAFDDLPLVWAKTETDAELRPRYRSFRPPRGVNAKECGGTIRRGVLF